MRPFQGAPQNKKAHHLFSSGDPAYFSFSSFMEAPSIRHPFFVLRLTSLGFDSLYSFNPKPEKSQGKKGGRGKRKDPDAY
jgi:hypothetical protein